MDSAPPALERVCESTGLRPPPGLPPPPSCERAVAREPLPLPVSFVGSEERRPGLSRGSARRVGRCGAVASDVRSCIEALNVLHGGPGAASGGTPAPGGPSLAQQHVLSHVTSCVKALGPPPSELATPEALELLRLCPYHVGGGPVPYDPARISLPDAGTCQRDLASLWGLGGDEVVQAFCSSRVLPRDAARRVLSKCAPQRPYGDPSLRELHAYAQFFDTDCTSQE